MSEVKRQTAGLLFNESGSRIALIQKKRPEWMAGMWNGIGGNLEAGETPYQAQVREFHEETGIIVEGWKLFCIYQSLHDTEIHWFVAMDEIVHETCTMTDEKVGVFSVRLQLPRLVPNVAGLIDFALAVAQEQTPAIEIVERKFIEERH